MASLGSEYRIASGYTQLSKTERRARRTLTPSLPVQTSVVNAGVVPLSISVIVDVASITISFMRRCTSSLLGRSTSRLLLAACNIPRKCGESTTSSDCWSKTTNSVVAWTISLVQSDAALSSNEQTRHRASDERYQGDRAGEIQVSGDGREQVSLSKVLKTDRSCVLAIRKEFGKTSRKCEFEQISVYLETLYTRRVLEFSYLYYLLVELYRYE